MRRLALVVALASPFLPLVPHALACAPLPERGPHESRPRDPAPPPDASLSDEDSDDEGQDSDVEGQVEDEDQLEDQGTRLDADDTDARHPGDRRFAEPYRWPARGPRGEGRELPREGFANPREETGERPRGVDYAALEEAVLDEMNLLRRDPRRYADKLAAMRPFYRGNLVVRGEGRPSWATQEGVAALDEAVLALRRAPRRLPRLAWADGLARAAKAHARDLGRNDLLGHEGSDGSHPDARVKRQGQWDGMVAENISFGPTDAEEIVMGLLVDDGVPDRGHRDVLLTRELFFAGVGCGPHPSYGATCVADYATTFKSGRARAPRPEVRDLEGEQVW